MKIKKEKEKIKIRGYLGKVEELECNKIEIEDFEFYLYKGKKYWEVYEKNTGKIIVAPKKSKKEVIEKLYETLKYRDRLKEWILQTIAKDGYIKDYEVGTYIRQ